MAAADGVERIESSFRHGSITAVGVFTAFSLGFLTAWGANPIPWGLKDLLPLTAIAIGVIFEMVALARLLDPQVLEVPRYRAAIRVFLIGMVLVAIGVAAALFVDFITTLEGGASAAVTTPDVPD
ncbi:MAG TPA: hypothetical protein VHA70_03730 [Bauldia sp.]|nr:hypothetical protein [Bauldia sp.]